MNQMITEAAAGLLAPRVLRVFRLRWLAYGAAAYVALRYMNKRGILPRQTGAALDAIDHSFAAIRNGVGLGRVAEAPTLH